MRTPEWYDAKVHSIKKRKREITNGDYNKSKERKKLIDGLTREKRAAKRGEKQDAKKMMEEEIWNWKQRKK